MCGITGLVDLRHQSNLVTLKNMTDVLFHRGPDDGGYFFEDYESFQVGLGHRRLSILDLSNHGHQPMFSETKRYIIVFNGEIYNHLELRKELKKTLSVNWRGHSDTETLLACFTRWGIEKTLQATVGMFAIAVWDREEHSLILARDRMGEKPLYYGWQSSCFLFGSEIKALKQHHSFENTSNWAAANSFLQLNYIPAPHTIYNGIYKLIPGTFIKFTQKHLETESIPEPIAYWSLHEAAINGKNNQFKGSFEDATDELERLLRQAVGLQSIADVPVGAFLSGGIDSSTIVALMKSHENTKVTTFSIGMTESKLDESKHAAAVAKFLGTEHIEYTLQASDVLDLIPRLTKIWDEPFADSSQIPTYLVSKLAKEKVTVALSGDGGDEFFLGYSQYELYQRLWKTRHLGKLPWDRTFSVLSGIDNENLTSFLQRAKYVVDAWRQPNTQALHHYWMNNYRHDTSILNQQYQLKMLDFPILEDIASTAALWDAGTYLPDDILVKVDRAAMANSLETRTPLLDHRIVEFAYTLPLQYKLHYRINKRVLREVLYRHIPKKIVDRPKMGFSIPLSSWLKNELRDWAENIITQIPYDSERLNKNSIEKLWKEFLSGEQRHVNRLWSLLILSVFSI